MTSAQSQPVHGYAREAVDDFCAAARAERARLEVTISDAESRARRARAAVGMHHVMVSMLLDTQRELAELRISAEAEAAEIIGIAEEEAQEIVRAANDETHIVAVQPVDHLETPATGPSHSAPADLDQEPRYPVVEQSESPLDLTAVEREEQRLAHPSSPAPSALYPPIAPAFDSFGNTQADEQFFAYLRGALADERPLGPRFE